MEKNIQMKIRETFCALTGSFEEIEVDVWNGEAMKADDGLGRTMFVRQRSFSPSSAYILEMTAFIDQFHLHTYHFNMVGRASFTSSHEQRR